MHTRFIALLLIVSSLSMNLSGLFVFAGFEMNRDYIAKELCINKNKPELHCNGKCYLMRKLKQAEEKEQKQEQQLLKVYLQQPAGLLRVVHISYAYAEIAVHIPQSTGKPLSAVNTVFHPPQFI